MPDVHHISILHDVVFAFQAESAAGTGICLRACFKKLVPARIVSARMKWCSRSEWIAPAP